MTFNVAFKDRGNIYSDEDTILAAMTTITDKFYNIRGFFDPTDPTSPLGLGIT